MSLALDRLFLCWQTKRFVDGNTIPILWNFQTECKGGSGSGIYGVDSCSELYGLDARTRCDPWDGHIFGHAGTVGCTVAPMIGGNDDQRFSAQVACIQFRQEI